jgi:hypothetical protein
VVAKSPPQHRIKSALSRYQRQPSGRNLGHDDEASWYRSLGDTLASQEAVNHTAKGYARYIPYPGATNPFTDAHGHHEHRRGIFSIFKRGMKGIN